MATVDTDGLFNPTLKTVLIQSVQRDLPAALAGITVGDSVVEVDSVPVAGSKAVGTGVGLSHLPADV